MSLLWPKLEDDILQTIIHTEWSKISENTALYDCVIVDLTPLNVTFSLFMTSHGVICVSEFVLFNDKIFALLMFRHIDNDELCERKCNIRQGQKHLDSVIEQVEEVLRATCHIGTHTLNHVINQMINRLVSC